MKIKDLIALDSIKELIKTEGEKGRSYKSEAQFQFELAWSIKELIQDSNCDHSPEVYLEYFSAYRKSSDGHRNKFFTDIMIIDDLGNYIPIELKYKTTSIKNANSDFEDYGTHGATDLGRFDFLWDVKRIQILKNHSAEGFSFNPELKTFNGGYAIMLSNDSHYWNVTKAAHKDMFKRPLYYDFCIGNGDTINKGSDLLWKNDGIETCVERTWRNNHDYVVPLRFDRDHICEWQSYYHDRNDFQFIVLNI